MESGRLYADNIYIYSNPALDRCQVLSAYDNVYASTWVVERIPGTGGTC